MSKSSNRFAGYQERTQAARVTLIDEFLASIKKSRVRFPNPTALAELLAKYVESEQGEPCAPSTMLRNPKYRALVLGYFTKTSSGVGSLLTGPVDSDQSKIAVFTAELQAANLTRQVERLTVHIADLERREGNRLESPPDAACADAESFRTAIEEEKIKHAKTCQALHTLLRSMEALISVDPEAEVICDRSKLINNVIVESRLLSPFFEWLRANNPGLLRDV